MSDLDETLDAFWRNADDTRPEQMWAALEDIVRSYAPGEARATFERASMHDFLGEEEAAVPLYRAALTTGLDAPQRTEAIVQLASSLRNVGDHSGAIALLQAVTPEDPLYVAARAFLALALLDDDKPARAVSTALHALAPHVPLYGRAVEEYADLAIAPRRIRVIAVGLVVVDDWVLAELYPETEQRGAFLRAPGGGVEFGENADAAVRREIREELGAVVDDARLLAVTENIFSDGEKDGHEIAHVFAVASEELQSLPRGDRLRVLDGDTSVGWYRLADIRAQAIPFYPVGVAELAEALAHGGSTPV